MTRQVLPGGPGALERQPRLAHMPLDAWVLAQACRQARAWLTEAGLNVKIAVNLSAMQFRCPDPIDAIVSAVQTAGLDPRCLE
ncbi:MAG: hypothetical protein ACRET5_13510, partial [Steroidobacteraceae bacterium]